MNETPEHPTLSEVGDRLRDDIELVRDAVRRETDDLRRSAFGFVQEHPYSAVAAAFGVGFVLSGGLFSRATAKTVSFGTRFLLGRFLKQLIAGAGAGLLFPSEMPERQQEHH